MDTATKIQTALISALVNEGGSATFATLVAVVGVDQLKTGNPYKNCEIRKRTEYNVILNANYARMVNNKREKEGKEADFKAVPNWMVKVFDCDNGNICTHRKDAILNEDGTFQRFSTPTPRLYMMVFCNTANKAKTTNYFINGKAATKEQIETIKQFIPAKKEGTSQDLENPVIVRTITLYNEDENKGIEEIHANGLNVEFQRIF